MAAAHFAESAPLRMRKEDDSAIVAVLRFRQARERYDTLCAADEAGDGIGNSAETKLAEFVDTGTLYVALTTPPTTATGALALVRVIENTLDEGEHAWAGLGLKTLAAGLQAIDQQ